MLYFLAAIVTYFLYCIAIEKAIMALSEDEDVSYFDPMEFRMYAYLFCIVIAAVWPVGLPFIICASAARWIAKRTGSKK